MNTGKFWLLLMYVIWYIIFFDSLIWYIIIIIDKSDVYIYTHIYIFICMIFILCNFN